MMRVENEHIYYSDHITVVSSRMAFMGYWWARGDRVPWLPVLVHVTAARASGVTVVATGDCFEAEVIWRPKGAHAVRLRPVR